ncbi:sulfatase-like hydrolase/transferase [bacterium]|nr:sulfatase-like hydrolase/transferase [bacterium]
MRWKTVLSKYHANRIVRMTAIAMTAVLMWGSSTAHAVRPNIILIMADDSAVDNYGCYGSTFFSTPRLDELAKTGARFTHCYSEPVCTASRVKIMTGRDNVRNYVAFGTLDKSETTFGTMMKNAGYATAIAGKWQLHGGANGSLAPDCGFDTYCLWNYPGTQRSRFWNPSIMRDGELLNTTEKDYGPDIFTDYLIDFITQHKDDPFFVYYPMVLVHSPFLKTPDSKKGTPNKKDGGLSNFRDMTAYADKCVGRIVDSLDKLKLRDNTVVIYTTDNGTGRGLTYPFEKEQRKGEKAYATEGGSHAPLIINSPRLVNAGIVCDDMVDFSDVLPTLADIAGAKLPDVKLDGRSFWPQCLGKQGNPRQYIFQYYYPKFTTAAEAHGQGVNNNEIIWAQDQNFKLYADGTLYAVSDRYEKHPIAPGDNPNLTAETARQLLSQAIKSMPGEGQKLSVKPKKNGK